MALDPELLIRPLTSDDRDEWEPLWQLYLRFYEEELASAVTETLWERLLSPIEEPRGFIAVLDEQAVGIVHFLRHRSTWAVADKVYLEDLYVAEGARGRGVGRALIEAVVATATAEKLDTVHWLTTHDNAVARGLYDQLAVVTPFVQYERALPASPGPGHSDWPGA